MLFTFYQVLKRRTHVQNKSVSVQNMKVRTYLIVFYLHFILIKKNTYLHYAHPESSVLHLYIVKSVQKCIILLFVNLYKIFK